VQARQWLLLIFAPAGNGDVTMRPQAAAECSDLDDPRERRYEAPRRIIDDFLAAAEGDHRLAMAAFTAGIGSRELTRLSAQQDWSPTQVLTLAALNDPRARV